jgi:TPR repeat protein
MNRDLNNSYTAILWFLKAAEQGDALAQYNLGICYYYGKGVPKQDKNTALYWLEMAYMQKYELPSFNLTELKHIIRILKGAGHSALRAKFKKDSE